MFSRRTLMKSHRISSFPLPIRLRPCFLLLTALLALLLGLLGFTHLARALPLNGKVLHVVCFCLATAVFYFILDVDEDARRIWFWRHANVILTAVVCLFFGGFVSELVRSLLPHRQFDLGNVLANVTGSSVGLYTAYYLEKHYRSRREIDRLYRPLDADDTEDAEYSDDETGSSRVQLLPIFNPKPALPKPFLSSKVKARNGVRLGNVWDDREELFGVGDDSGSEDTPSPVHPNGSVHAGSVPIITITHP